MEMSQSIMVAGRNGEVVLAKDSAYSAFCQIGYATMVGDSSVEYFSEGIGEKHYAVLAEAYKQDQWSNGESKVAMHFNNTLVLTEDAAVAFLELVRLANDNPELVNRTALNGGAAEALTGIRIR